MKIYGHILQSLSNAETDLQFSKVIQAPEVLLNQRITGLDRVWIFGNILNCTFRYIHFCGCQVLNSFRNWIWSSESVRQFYTLSSCTAGCIFSGELELKEQREKRYFFFFRSPCIFRKIFTIIFFSLLDNNRLVRAERGSWVQFCTVAVTSSSGEVLALFLPAARKTECTGLE